MRELPRYPKIRSPEKQRHDGIFGDPVVVQEKLDGSQFSFGLDDEGNLVARSKNTHRDMHSPDGMFGPAIRYLRTVEDLIPEEAVLRAETLATPSHNILDYDDHPDGHVALFGAETREGEILPVDEVVEIAERLGVDHAPVLHQGPAPHDSWQENWAWVEEFLERESYLGGARIEGVVVKNYHRPTRYAKFTPAKVVRDDFKERQHESPAAQNHKTILEELIAEFSDEDAKKARWRKVLQHAREEGKLDGEPADLAMLIPDLQEDLEAESEDIVKERFWEWARDPIFRAVRSGFPEWYKERLREREVPA